MRDGEREGIFIYLFITACVAGTVRHFLNRECMGQERDNRIETDVFVVVIVFINILTF